MSFFSNFNILIGILLVSTNLLESNEDMIFSISDLSVGLIKKENIRSILKKVRKMLKNEILSFVLPAIEEK